MAITQRSRWDDYGVEPLAGEAKYRAGEQPIAEYDNWFNKAVVEDIAALNRWLDNLGITKIYIDTEANKPASGTNKELFIATDTNKIYRGTGTGWQLLTTEWNAILNKPFNSLGSEFTVSNGYLQISGIDASKITSGRLSLSRLPTSSTANRFLVVRTANADPTYDALTADDMPTNWNGKSISGLGSLTPVTDNSYDLGSSTQRWRNAYLGYIELSGDGLRLKATTNANILFEERTTGYSQGIHFLNEVGTKVTGIGKNPSDDLILGAGVSTGDHTKEVRIDVDGNMFSGGNGIADLGKSTNKWRQGFFSGEVVAGLSVGSGQFRAVASNYGVIFRNDDANFYILLTNSGDPYGSWNTLRPFRINLASGDIYLGNGRVIVQHSTGNLLPNVDNAIDIGSSSSRFRNLYLAGAVKFADGSEISSAYGVGGITYSTPTVYLGNGENLQLARFKLPTNKTFKVLKAQVAKSDGTSATNLTIEVYDATNGTTVYSTASNTVQEGSPLATSNAGVEIIIRIKNNTGAAVECQGFVVGVIS